MTTAATFQSGYKLSANAVPLPSGSFNQKDAVVDGIGASGNPSNAMLNANLRDINGNAYPSGGCPAESFSPTHRAVPDTAPHAR